MGIYKLCLFLQERCELLFLDQRSVLFRSESGGGVTEGSAGRRTRLLSTHTASEHTRKEHHSSAESFASAEDQVTGNIYLFFYELVRAKSKSLIFSVYYLPPIFQRPIVCDCNIQNKLTFFGTKTKSNWPTNKEYWRYCVPTCTFNL